MANEFLWRGINLCHSCVTQITLEEDAQGQFFSLVGSSGCPSAASCGGKLRI